MPRYTIYDLLIASDFPLEGLLPGGEGDPDVTISRRPLEPMELEGGTSATGERIAGLLDHRMPLLIEGGHTVVFNPPEAMLADEVAGYITGVILAAVLRQRGLFVLHASAPARNGEAVAFIGNSGWGKSTLAEAFLQQGYDVLTDDILALEFMGGEVRIRPGPPYIRLRSGAGEALLPDSFESLPRVAARGDQRLRTLPGRSSAPVRLRGIFVLDPDNAPQSVVEPVTGHVALLPLLANSWGKAIFVDEDARTRHLQECGELARRVPIYRLRRVRSLAALPEHIALVEEAVGLASPAC